MVWECGAEDKEESTGATVYSATSSSSSLSSSAGTSSCDDSSDTDATNARKSSAEQTKHSPAYRAQRASGIVRSKALQCLSIIAKNHSKVFYEHWFSLLPPDSKVVEERNPFSGRDKSSNQLMVLSTLFSFVVETLRNW